MRSKSILVMIVVVLIALLTQPATAIVVVACQNLGGGVVEFSYDTSDESSLIRAFGLDITVDHGATIESIFNLNLDYNIYPGAIEIGEGGITDAGSPVVIGDLGGALPGLGTSGITVEMGSLYQNPEDAPPPIGTLFHLTIDLHNASSANVNMTLNTVRGGIVMEDLSSPTVNLVGCTVAPEPATLLLLALGGLCLRRKR